MDCKTIAEDKNKIFYTYFNTLDIILANVLNRFSSIHNLNGNKFYITILLVPSRLENKLHLSSGKTERLTSNGKQFSNHSWEGG